MRSKKNKKKLVIAIVFGLIATFSLFNSMNSQKTAMNQELHKLNKKIQQQGKQNPASAKNNSRINVVIAAKDIKVGDIFVLESLKIEEYPKDEVPEDFFKNKALLVGKKAGKNITTGGFITSKEIQSADNSTIDIPNDTRALTIPVEKFKGLASYIKVGSRVDILKVKTPPEFIVQNIRVVSFEERSINTSTASKKQKNKQVSLTAKNAGAITFLIPVDYISRVIDAMFEGQLQLITRNNSDEKILVTEADLPPPPGEIPEISTLPQDPTEEDLPEPKMIQPDPKKIEFIKASNISSVEFDAEQLQNMNTTQDDSLSDEKLNELLDMVN